MQKSKMAVWEALQIAMKRREAKSKGNVLEVDGWRLGAEAGMWAALSVQM